jgi:aryl-phospho-beta-D-glucosidase BglC (GH1 family)
LVFLALLAPLTALSQTPAHEAAKGFMRGVNFANFLEVPPGQSWRVGHSVADLKFAREEGFDHVRLPIGWQFYAGPAPEFRLSDGIFAQVDETVTNATALGLNVLINIHGFDAFTKDPEGTKAEFLAIWRQVAAHYSNAPSALAFELLNEPRDPATTVVMNPIYAEAIHLIRRTNPRRTIFAGPGRWNSVKELDKFELPEDDRNIIVTVHCYEPFYFTHQGATWAGPDVKVRGILFPGPPKEPLVPAADLELHPWVRKWIERYNTEPEESNPCNARVFGELINKARVWSAAHNRPVHFGEFGCYTSADADSRVRFYAAFRQALGESRIGWAIWDWKSGFRYWDAKMNQPVPGMREALFGGTSPALTFLKRFESAPAVGPEEAPMPARAMPDPNTNTVPQWPGRGLGQHPFLYYGEGNNVLYVVNNGKVAWTYAFARGGEIDDAWLMSNGHIILTKMRQCYEVTPDKKIVWTYTPPETNEIHTCQPVGLDKVMIVQNGLPPHMIILNKKDNSVAMQHELPAVSANDPKTVHPQYRNCRVTGQGTYLIACLKQNKVIEYDKEWKEIWSVDAQTPWAAVRLKNGDTLISGDPGAYVHEVNPKGEIVWGIEKNELPGIPLHDVQTANRLANGNTIICNRGGGRGGDRFAAVQVVEVTPEKKVVWVLQDYVNLGPCTGIQLLDEPGTPEIPGELAR